LAVEVVFVGEVEEEGVIRGDGQKNVLSLSCR
jgi:hypothetical protein